MKSSNEQLKDRGYATIEYMDKYIELNEINEYVLMSVLGARKHNL